MGYSWAQFRLYLQLAERRGAADRLARLVDCSAAFHGGEGTKKLVAALQQAANGKG